MSDHPKRAPGQPDEHPDWFLSLSGGIDSAAAALVAKDAIKHSNVGGNFAKIPLAIYLDTRTGVPLNRLYVEQLADYLGIQLWTLRTNEKFEERIQENGAPGAAAHQIIRDRLKERQPSKLSSLSDRPVMVLGLAADESDNRAALPKINEKDKFVEVYPVHRLPRKRRVEIILRHEDCPRNPLWENPGVITDCGCLANGDPSELDKTEELFPEFGQRLREWEESIDHDGLKGTLGWSGLAGAEKSAVESGHEQLTLCSGGCQRERDPAVVRAFKARSRGATVEESVSILYDEDPPTSKKVAVADGGNQRSLQPDTEHDEVDR